MKNNCYILYLIILISASCQMSFAQSQNLKDLNRPDAYAYVEKMPEYPGGTKALYAYLADCISTDSSVTRDTSGFVIVQFYVEKDGSVTSPKAVRSPNQDLGKAALKYVSAMPKWKPALMNDTAVVCVFTLPVKFGRISLDEKD